jgi:hypothetical protein
MGPRAQAQGAEVNHMSNPYGAYHEQYDAPPLPLVYFGEIEPSVDVRDFVQGLLMEQGAAVLYGESNSGKTFLATDLALHVAAGIEWHGRRVEQGGVLYLALEGGIGFRNRVAAWREAHDCHAGQIHFAAIPSQVNLLDPEADTPRVITAAQTASEKMGVGITLIVVDTLARAMSGGNENAPDDMGALVTNMDAIREATGAMVLFIHHSGKDAAKGARGHSSLRAAIDTEIEVEAGGGEVRNATVVKQRDMKKGDVISFTLEVVEIGENRHGEMVTTCLVRQAATGTHKPLKRARLAGHSQVAMDALHDVLGRAGATGHGGVPASVPSVPEAWWRENFYSKTVGDSQDTKKKAFQRAVADLQGKRMVGVNNNRVWAVHNDVGGGT